MKHFIVFFILASLFICCEKDKSYDDELKGKWIRRNCNSDTMIFRDENFFELRRGFYYDSVSEIRIPITPCGLFTYDYTDSSIYIQWTASSYIPSEPIPGYFKLMDNRFEIANFMDSAETIMIFDKME
jgi:hypothetical protein